MGGFWLRGSVGVYHVMSRTACGQYLFDDEAKRVFVNMLRKQAGFCGELKWTELLPEYRLILYGKGARSKGTVGKDEGRIESSQLERVLKNGGRLSLPDILRCRVRYFTAGTAIGSNDFLADVSDQWKARHGLERKRDAYPMRGGEWGTLRTFRKLQVNPVGKAPLN